MPFVLSLSKHRPSSARRKKEQPFDKLRANGVQGFFVASWLCASPKNPPSLRPSIPRQNPVHQLLHRRGEVVRIKGIGFEVERGMAREHQILLDVAAMRDVLQRFLDTEAARVGEIAGDRKSTRLNTRH